METKEKQAGHWTAYVQVAQLAINVVMLAVMIL